MTCKVLPRPISSPRMPPMPMRCCWTIHLRCALIIMSMRAYYERVRPRSCWTIHLDFGRVLFLEVCVRTSRVARIHISMCALFVCVCMYMLYARANSCVSIHVCTSVYMYVSASKRVYACMHACAYINIHIHTRTPESFQLVIVHIAVLNHSRLRSNGRAHLCWLRSGFRHELHCKRRVASAAVFGKEGLDEMPVLSVGNK